MALLVRRNLFISIKSINMAIFKMRSILPNLMTIVLAGNIAGETDTVPLAIYGLLQFPGTENQIIGLVAVSIVLALGCLLSSRLLDRRHRQRLELEV